VIVRKLVILLLCLAPLSELRAQQVDDRFPAQDSGRADVRYAFRPLRIAKWTTLLVSGGAAAYGFTENRTADRDYEQLERECEAQPLSCLKGPDGEAYANAEMEQRYQRIVERDDRARLALLGGQIGLAASVIMFIIDLPDRVTPEDIPYDPRPLRVGLRRDGSTELAFSLGLGRR
jgi:hypothetical protein